MNISISPDAQATIDQHRHAVRLSPRNANAHALLGLSLLRERQIEAGVVAVRRALELDPKISGLRAVLAAALADLNRDQEAATCYQQALRFQNDADLHRGLAEALLRLHRAPESEASARRAVALAPANIANQLSLVAALHAQSRLEDTCEALRRVLELDPEQVNARYDLGHISYKLGQYAQALTCLEQVVQHEPAHVRAWHYLALSQRAMGKLEQAFDTLQHARMLDPSDLPLRADTAATLQMQGKLREAIAVGQGVLEVDPANIMALRANIHSNFTLGEWQEALRLSYQACELAPSPVHHSMFLFVLSHCCQDADKLTREHFDFGERWEQPLREQRRPHANDRDPQRKLRIGLVSADLYRHAVARFIAPVVSVMKDSTQVQFYVYYNNTVEDDMMRALRADVAAWRPIKHLGDEAVDELIREDQIDILIDLSGHSAMNRLTLFARKPAPVQATWIGYAGTTGLEAMDYILCDQFLVPGKRYDAQFKEQIVRLPLGSPFLPEQSAPPVNDLPALTNGYITFGSFHRASKLGRDVIAQWALLLHAIPNSKVLLGGIQTGIDDVLIEWFAHEGIPRERLLLRERSAMPIYLAQLGTRDRVLCRQGGVVGVKAQHG